MDWSTWMILYLCVGLAIDWAVHLACRCVGRLVVPADDYAVALGAMIFLWPVMLLAMVPFWFRPPFAALGAMVVGWDPTWRDLPPFGKEEAC